MVSNLLACTATVARDEGRALEARMRGAALLDTLLSVDLHSHAGGDVGRNTIQHDIASPMRQGKLSALCMSLVSDSVLLARSNQSCMRGERPGPANSTRIC